MTSHRVTRWLLALIVIVLLSGIAASLGLAQIGNGFDLHWNVYGGGGGISTGSGFTIQDSIGQNAVGWTSSSTNSLGSGFWYDFYLFHIRLPIIRKQ